MSPFKIQRIRSCVQCGDVLGLKCMACVKHPNRKPKIVEVYDWPTILETCPSGDCLKISCQRPGCVGTMWRSRSHTRGRKMKYETMYCSRECNIAALAKARDTRVTVPCGWHACNAKVQRKASTLKTFKRAFCRPDHYFLTLRREAHDAREGKRLAEKGDDGRSLMECEGKCSDVTDHIQAGRSLAKCVPCGTVRSTRVAMGA